MNGRGGKGGVAGGLTSKWVVVATSSERILFSLVIFKFLGQGVFANAASVNYLGTLTSFCLEN